MSNQRQPNFLVIVVDDMGYSIASHLVAKSKHLRATYA
jgi:hypothetical protein